MFSQVARRLAPAGVLVSVALAGCNTVGSINRTGGVAVVEEQTKEASGANISSLSEVIQRKPAAPPMHASPATPTPSTTLTRRSRSIPITPGLRQPGAGVQADQPQRRGARRFQPRHRRRPVLCAGLSRPRQPPAGAG